MLPDDGALCLCGCGETVRPGRMYVYMHHNRGPHGCAWTGGIVVRGGRVYVRDRTQSYPLVNGGKYTARYVLVAEKMLGRKLARDEVVHHLNGDCSDDRPENLRVMSNRDHSRLHWPSSLGVFMRKQARRKRVNSKPV